MLRVEEMHIRYLEVSIVVKNINESLLNMSHIFYAKKRID